MKTIRVHNKGKRSYTIPPRKAGGKERVLEPGRAVDLEEETAEKYISLYPRDLMYFDDLVAGEGKTANLKDENKILSAENKKLKKELEALKAAQDPKTGEKETNAPDTPATGEKETNAPDTPATGEKGSK